MRISEIFHSIQGEGLLLGVPSVFVRTSGCNLRCHWCDTPYASWNPEGENMEIAEIVAKVKAYNCSHVVLTGGEPMIASGMHELAGALKALGQHITIETAGTVLPERIACDLASLSPKLANSTPSLEQAGPWRDRHEASRIQPKVIREWLESYSAQLKFVVSSSEDLAEIKGLLSEIANLNNGGAELLPPSSATSPHNFLHSAGGFTNDRVLLMPEGTDVETLRERGPLLAKLCLQHGFRYAPRLQIELFGNTRGT